MKHVLTMKSFFPRAGEMRGVFEERFGNPHSASADRFVWDFWSVPDQYRMVRTPAYHYFPSKLYRSFHEHLVQWGRETLGCHDVSPPWLSYYVDGCRQGLHADVPHGPWAFVFSLSPKKIKFQGGETLILKPETLNYWPSFSDARDREFSSFVDRVPSPFNQLTVFDPRFPHGVTEVKGTENPLEARLVVHGWFVEPRPYVVGALSTSQVQKTLDRGLAALAGVLEAVGALHGTVSFRLHVTRGGMVKSYQSLTDTLIGLEAHEPQTREMRRALKALFSSLEFPRARGESRVTVPLLFK